MTAPPRPNTARLCLQRPRAPRANAFARAHRSSAAMLKSGLFIPMQYALNSCGRTSISMQVAPPSFNALDFRLSRTRSHISYSARTVASPASHLCRVSESNHLSTGPPSCTPPGAGIKVMRGPRKIPVACSRRHLWGEQHRIGRGTNRNHSRANSGQL
jgi:hypothetical protein